MPKLDSLWVPGKTAALECHGLILYGNQMLVMKEDGVTDLGRIVFNRNAVSHEIAHIFFGNMVGSSWAEVWLKEGITTYMSYVGTSAIWPELDQMRHMIYEVISTALETDVRNGTHPMRHEAHTNKEIGRNMGIIGYDKGASLVKMLVGILGEDAFYKGIRQYLAEFHDRVATQQDFFAKLNEAVEEERISLPAHVKEIMTPWTDQEGFPLVKVTWVEPGRVILSQERFENDEMRRIENASSSDEVFWDIPVRYVVIRKNGVKYQDFVWLRKDGKSVELAINGSGEWTLLVNSDGAGYFRVLYDEEHLLPRIVRQLIVDHSMFTVEARARLLDDQLNLALQKYIPIQTAMEFTKYLGQETNPTVWFCVLHKLLKIFYLFRPLVKGLQTREDYIALKESLLLQLPQQNVDSNITAVNFVQTEMSENDELAVPLTISVLEHELIQRLKLNGLDDQDFKAFKDYLLPRINSTLVRIASNSENGQNRFPGSHNFSFSSVGILESFMIDWSCSLQSDWCMQYILRQMADWVGHHDDGIGSVSDNIPNPIPTDIQASLYCHIVHWLGEVAFKWIFAKAQGINDTTQETWLTVALGCAQENKSFSNILNMLTANGHADYNLSSNSSSTHLSTLPQPETINKVYAKSLYSKIMQHSEIGTIFITLLLTILLPESEYLSYFHFSPGNESATEISELFGYSQDSLWTEFHLEMIQDLVASNPEFYGDSLNLTISSIQSNMQWMSEFRENLTSWFRESV